MDNEEIDDNVLAVLKNATKRRISRITMYLLLSVGALISSAAPSQVVLDQSSYSVYRIWSIAFGIAAVTCLIGAISDRWFPEYTMIPLLFTTLLIFGITLISQSYEDSLWRISPYGLFFIAFSC